VSAKNLAVEARKLCARSAARSLPRCGRRTRTGGKDAPSKLAAMSAPCVAGSAIFKRRAIDVWPQKESRACLFQPMFCSFPPNVCVTISGPLGVSNRDKRREDGESHDAERAISRTCAECWAEGSSAIAPASEIINAQQRYLGSQELRRVRGSTVPHRPHQRGAAFGAALARSVSTQLFARQRWQASASVERHQPTGAPRAPPAPSPRRSHTPCPSRFCG
jgi:hypothetical protein